MFPEVRGEIADAKLLFRQAGYLCMTIGHSPLYFRILLCRQIAIAYALLPIVPHEEVFAVVVSLFLARIGRLSQSQKFLASPLRVSRQIQGIRQPAPGLHEDIAQRTMIVILRRQCCLPLAALCHQPFQTGNSLVQHKLL